ncbi:MAG: GntR family transcriptional regulator [Lachnospirales bacterium]
MKEELQTASEQAYEIISKKILTGEFPPGMKLSKRKMAAVTGVSVIPVIEALNKLEDEGLVESKPQWGSFVMIPTKEKIEDILVLREAIECQIAREVVCKITKEDEKELRELGEIIDLESFDKQMDLLISESHFKFHMKLAKITGYNSLENSLRKINLFWLLCKAVTATREKKEHPRDWHGRLIDALTSGDPDVAEKQMRIHVLDSTGPLIDAMTEE